MNNSNFCVYSDKIYWCVVETQHIVSDEVLRSLSDIQIRAVILKLVIIESQLNIMLNHNNIKIEHNFFKIIIHEHYNYTYPNLGYYYNIVQRWNRLHHNNEINLFGYNVFHPAYKFGNTNPIGNIVSILFPCYVFDGDTINAELAKWDHRIEDCNDRYIRVPFKLMQVENYVI